MSYITPHMQDEGLFKNMNLLYQTIDALDLEDRRFYLGFWEHGDGRGHVRVWIAEIREEIYWIVELYCAKKCQLCYVAADYYNCFLYYWRECFLDVLMNGYEKHFERPMADLIWIEPAKKP